MTYAGATTVLETHLTAAGTAVSPSITDIGAGEPGVPPGRCTRWWYMGETEPPHFPGGRTFTDEIVGERIHIQSWWPVSTRDKPVAAALETDVRAWVRSIRNRLIGDRTFGGNCVDSGIGRAEVGWMTEAAWRVAWLEIVLEFVDTDTIAP